MRDDTRSVKGQAATRYSWSSPPRRSARSTHPHFRNCCVGQVGDWRFEVDAAVRALLVVMGDELPQYAVEMAFAADEHPVQALGPGCEHEPFRERVRLGRSKGCLDNPGAERSHHLVKGPDELAVPVTDEEPEGSALVLQGGDQVPGLLGDPGPDRVSRYAGQVDHAAVEVDEEQDIEASQRDRVDVEEVAGKGASGLGSQELRPRRARSSEAPGLGGDGGGRLRTAVAETVTPSLRHSPTMRR